MSLGGPLSLALVTLRTNSHIVYTMNTEPATCGRSYVLSFRTTNAERAQVVGAAKLEGVSVSDFLRAIVLPAVREHLGHVESIATD